MPFLWLYQKVLLVGYFQDRQAEYLGYLLIVYELVLETNYKGIKYTCYFKRSSSCWRSSVTFTPQTFDWWFMNDVAGHATLKHSRSNMNKSVD